MQLSETDPETSLDTIHEIFVQTAQAGAVSAPAITVSGAVVSDCSASADTSRQTELSAWPEDNARRWWPRVALIKEKAEG